MNIVEYKKIVSKNNKNKNKIISSVLAFLGGGTLGIISQALSDFGFYVLHYSRENSYAFSTLVIVSIACLLTILSFYNDISQILSAGLFVPTTGFANSVLSPSIEGRDEGLIRGIGARMFSLSGSVIGIGIFFCVFVTLIKYFLYIMGIISL
ncbi:MAG: SpoVA/SpoVAEb family sporulation membrane protein [Bacilli bacterium]